MFFCVSQSTSSINKVEGAVSQTNDTWYQETGKFWRFWTSWFFTVISIMALGANKRKETCSLHASGVHTSAIEPIEWEVKAIVENFSKPPCYGVTVRCFARLLASGCLNKQPSGTFSSWSQVHNIGVPETNKTTPMLVSQTSPLFSCLRFHLSW